MEIMKETTLKEAQAELRKNLEDGGICPCCKQHVQIYSRPITSSMAYALIIFYRYCKEKDLSLAHAESVFKLVNVPASLRGDFSKLRFWGLINFLEDGFYNVTKEGEAFVTNQITVLSHVRLYNNKMYGSFGKNVNIKDCLKKKFDLDKLMKGLL